MSHDLYFCEYSADYQRIKSVTSGNAGATLNKRYYFGDFERDITGAVTRDIHYIGADGLNCIIEKIGTTVNYYYVYKDYLGSILTVTNAAGSIVEERNYDAWGKNRNPTDWIYTNIPTSSLTWLTRGYTGHEHLQQFGLINMNGRLYDPILGRMLSPDNYTQGGSQGYNRYTYAMNNPLKYTDPDGQNPFLIMGIGALVGGIGNSFAEHFKGNTVTWGTFLKGAAGGALAAGGATSVLGGFYAGALSAINSNIPGFSIRLGGLTLSLSPAFMLGTSAFGIGLNIGASVQIGDFSIGGSIGISAYGASPITGKAGTEMRYGASAGYDDGFFGITLGTTQFGSGETSQRLGYGRLKFGRFSLSYENDGTPFQNIPYLPLGDGGDSYRTAAGSIGWDDWVVGVKLGTGKRIYEDDIDAIDTDKHCGYTACNGNKWDERWVNPKNGINDYRLGALFVGYKGYELGWNHDDVRHNFQNRFAHTLIQPQPWIPRMYAGNPLYTNFRTSNPNTHW